MVELKGLPHTLTALHQGGVGSMIQENGKFVGSAYFYAMSTQVVVMGALIAMSVVSGQHFLAQINSEMKMMKMKLDEILEFLYGDKNDLGSTVSRKAKDYAELSSLIFTFSTYYDWGWEAFHEKGSRRS